jgi:hypothetical protein
MRLRQLAERILVPRARPRERVAYHVARHERLASTCPVAVTTGKDTSLTREGPPAHYGSRMDEPLIINVADAPAFRRAGRATLIRFEPEDPKWPDTGVNIHVLEPGQANSLYHSEPVQEDFLVLHGECVVILDGEERPLSGEV